MYNSIGRIKFSGYFYCISGFFDNTDWQLCNIQYNSICIIGLISVCLLYFKKTISLSHHVISYCNECLLTQNFENNIDFIDGTIIVWHDAVEMCKKYVTFRRKVDFGKCHFGTVMKRICHPVFHWACFYRVQLDGFSPVTLV